MHPPVRGSHRQRATYSAPALEKGLDIIELLASLLDAQVRFLATSGTLEQVVGVLPQR